MSGGVDTPLDRAFPEPTRSTACSATAGNAASPNGSIGSTTTTPCSNLINTRNFQAGYQDWFNDDGQPSIDATDLNNLINNFNGRFVGLAVSI